MATQLQLRRGTTTDHTSFTGAVGEVTVDTTKDVLVVHDGTTAGGFPQAARANADGTISLIKKDGTSAGSINSSGLFNNTLTSTNTDQALTAAQGKVLNDNKVNKTETFSSTSSSSDVTASRVLNTTYTNSSGKPKYVTVKCTRSGVVDYQGDAYMIVNGDEVGRQTATTGYGKNQAVYSTVSYMVLSGQSYSVGVTNSMTIVSWWEI